MIKLRTVFFALPFAVLACASDDNNGGTPAGLSGSGNNAGSGGTTGSGNNGGTTGKTPDPATALQIDQCKFACDQQKTFGCYDAAKQATCLKGCAEANTDQADQFIRCVTSSSSGCDAECSTVLGGSPPSGGSGTGGTGGTSSGGNRTLCQKVCDKGVICGEVTLAAHPKCVEACDESDIGDEAKQCVLDTPCAKISDTCAGNFEPDGPPPGGNGGSSGSGAGASGGSGGAGGSDFPTPDRVQCESACTSITIAGDCFPPGTEAACKVRCATATPAKREEFYECVFESSPECPDQMSCYQTFQPK